MRVLHISDLHFHVYDMPLNSIFTKRLAGQLNLYLRRRLKFKNNLTRERLEKIFKEDWDYIILTGDLTTTSQEKEFSLSLDILGELYEKGKLIVMPGNHDYYLKTSEGLFYKYFLKNSSDEEKSFKKYFLYENVTLICLNMVKPNPLIYASGEMNDYTIRMLQKEMFELTCRKKEIWIAGHFPVIYPHDYRIPKRRSLPSNQRLVLESWFKAYNVRFYFHGHEHHDWIIGTNYGTSYINSGSFGKNGIATAIIDGLPKKVQY
ncbi:MAG: metallophosphoesterase [Candidatus Coatesbacteria bacterium]|nr:metallophosphoesterase [Candidatus Coatesbacteria bacterium]